MKNVTLIIFCLMPALTSVAQYDTSYNSTYYRQKVTQFRLLQNNEGGDYIFLGDSITDIGEWVEILNNKKVKNRGISSDNTFGVLARLDEVISRKPAKLFIMIGINDVANNVPDSIIVRNYTKIIKRINEESPATQVYIQSVLPTNNNFTEFKRHQNKDEHVKAINKALKVLAGQMNCVYVDLYAVMLDSEGKFDKQYTNDGLHLTGEGYMVWKNELEKSGCLK
ncbi:GDSL-type esterase/lipase family protein [Chitinophagaceae bacterium LWZ2-11]